MLYHIHDHASSHILLCFITYIITKRYLQNTKILEEKRNYITGLTRLIFRFKILDIKMIKYLLSSHGRGTTDPNQSTESTGGSIVSEFRLGHWS